MNTQPKHGFTLIELLICIAIIAILASIIFPVFGKARAKAQETTCLYNQRQLVFAISIFSQENDEKYPTTNEVWDGMKVEVSGRKALRCPLHSGNYVIDYGYNAHLSGIAVESVPQDQITTTTLTADSNTDNHMLYDKNVDVAFRHAGKSMASYTDGHVGLTGMNGIILSAAGPLHDASFEDLPVTNANKSGDMFITKDSGIGTDWNTNGVKAYYLVKTGGAGLAVIQPADGSQCAGLKDGATLTQDIAFPMTGTYAITMQATRRSGFAYTGNSIHIKLDGVDLGQTTPAQPSNNTAWETLTGPSFTIDGAALATGKHTITITNANQSDDSMIMVDNIKVIAI